VKFTVLVVTKKHHACSSCSRAPIQLTDVRTDIAAKRIVRAIAQAS